MISEAYALVMTLVEGQVGGQALQPAILLFEGAQLAQPRHPQVRVLPSPDVEGRLADPELATDVGGRGAPLDLAEGVRDLLFGELRLLHRSVSLLLDRRSRHSALVLTAHVFGGDVRLMRHASNVPGGKNRYK